MPRRTSVPAASGSRTPSLAAAAVHSDPLQLFHEAVQVWFRGAFAAPTEPQEKGWAAISRGESTLLLAPTGSGKTLAAFLFCLNRRRNRASLFLKGPANWSCHGPRISACPA